MLSDLYPLLRAVSPADINYTLNALATALEGRGESVGENLETLDAYLQRVNPQIPDIVEDLRLTARVSDLYVDVLPDVAQILRDTITTTGTLEGREAKLHALFRDVASFSDTARTFLDDNEDNLIRLGDLSAAQLRVFAKYAPEYPCLLGGIVGAGKAQAEAFRGFTLHIVLELLPNQPRGYTAADAPRFGDKRGPNCVNLPSPPGTQENPVTLAARLRRRRRRADRQGHVARRSRLRRRRSRRVGPTAWVWWVAPTRPACCAPCSARCSASRPSRSTTSACCSSRRWPGGRR